MFILALFCYLGHFYYGSSPVIGKIAFFIALYWIDSLHKKALVYFHTIGTRLLTFRVTRVNNIFLL